MKSIERLSSLTNLAFKTTYKDIPFVATEMASNWTAHSKWTNAFFAKLHGEVQVYIKKRFDQKSNTCLISLTDYICYMKNCVDEKPYYLIDWVWQGDIPEMRNDYSTPAIFKSLILKNVFSWMYIGPAKSGSPLHQDIASTAAWNVVISGQKRWAFYPPDQGKFLYNGKVDVFNPDLEKYPLFAQACAPLICIQNPGELVYTPSNWWHQVTNEEDCISITENFVNGSNFRKVKWPKLILLVCFNRIFGHKGIQRLRKWSVRPKVWK